MTTYQETDQTSSAKESAAGAAEEARARASDVASTAKDEVAAVVGESKRQAGDVLSQLRGQVDEQAASQRDRVVTLLRDVGAELDGMSGGDSDGPAHALARDVARRSNDLADRLDGRGAGDIAGDVRSFARRRPGTFLLGAFAVGLLAGRLTRGAVAAAKTDGDDGRQPIALPSGPHAAGTGAGPGAAAPVPPAGEGPAGPTDIPGAVPSSSGLLAAEPAVPLTGEHAPDHAVGTDRPGDEPDPRVPGAVDPSDPASPVEGYGRV